MKPETKLVCCRGFTFVEVMIAAGLLGLVTAGALGVYLMCHEIWHSTSIQMEACRAASMAITRLVYGTRGYNGLRGASSAATISARGYWTGTNYPPEPGSTNHYLDTNQLSNDSWRLVFSNSSDGVRWIDYNSCASNVVFWPCVTNQSTRELICNYVSSATVSNAPKGLSLSLTVARNKGRFSAVNRATTFVKLRNKK